MINFIELFAGSRTISQVAQTFNLNTLSIDRDIKDGINWNVDLRDVTVNQVVKKLGGKPNIFWSSPPCDSWSKLNWWRHWDRYVYKKSKIFVPVTETAYNGMSCVEKSIDFFLQYQDAIFFMENLEGLLSRHPVIQRLRDHRDVKFITRFTVTYCKYGFPHRKPTHIWTNCKSWIPKEACKKNETCHVASPRSMPALHAIKNRSFDRATIPQELGRECILGALSDIKSNGSSQ